MHKTLPDQRLVRLADIPRKPLGATLATASSPERRDTGTR